MSTQIYMLSVVYLLGSVDGKVERFLALKRLILHHDDQFP